MEFEILVVDDDPVVGFIHGNLIKKCHFPTPNFFLNGKLAVEHIKLTDNKDKSFLVFLDINMPIMDGWQFMDALKRSNILSIIYVAIVTSSVDSSDREKANTYDDIFHFLEKPLTIDKINQIKNHPSLDSLIFINKYL